MKQRGRQSTEKQTTVAPPKPWERPEPPAGSTPAEADLWREIVNSKPADWFDAAALPLLADFCMASVESEKIKTALRGNPQHGLERNLKALEALGRLKMSLATRLRLTPQSRYRPAAAAPSRPAGAKPWETK